LKELAALTGIPAKHLLVYVRRGRIDAYKHGSIWFVSREAAEAYLEARAQAA
jgi:excisionase family DNA binding protein